MRPPEAELHAIFDAARPSRLSILRSKGRARRCKPLTVAVLDPGGHLLVLEREDGSGILRPQMAHAKAWRRSAWERADARSLPAPPKRQASKLLPATSRRAELRPCRARAHP